MGIIKVSVYNTINILDIFLEKADKPDRFLKPVCRFLNTENLTMFSIA